MIQNLEKVHRRMLCRSGAGHEVAQNSGFIPFKMPILMDIVGETNGLSILISLYRLNCLPSDFRHSESI